MSLLFSPLISAALTEIAKWLGESVGPEWPALATKGVNVVIAYLLVHQGLLHLPPGVVPAIGALQQPLTAVLIALGGQALHDLSTWTAVRAGIDVPTAKVAIGLKTKAGGA